MIDFFRNLLSSDSFMPHGHCFLWDPGVLWLTVASDALIALSYYAIPLVLFLFIRKKKNLPFAWMFFLFCVFILLCGTTHVLDVWTVWDPAYRLLGLVKAATALVSIATAVLLIPLIPKALALRSPEELEAKNQELQKEIVERDRVKKLLDQSNKELQQFAYIASHDLQEPLRMVSSYVQLLQKKYKGKLDSDADEYIEFASDGARRMGNLINDLLAYSRLESQAKEFRLVDGENIFRNSLRDLQAAIKESGAVVTHDPLPRVMGDDVQLESLFQNLIGNAIKYRGKKTPQIHVSVEMKPGEWVFSVRDNGIGIDPGYFGRIFVIFQRLHARHEYSGTGIGLAVCKKIVERHGGRIWVESEPGKGATFYFTIPEVGA
ncbi:MAG: two-component sensor histidine kinase [Nitrospinae bacterium]|nr:two-component sensor histidine kinase [Nitrospinota bacterium]